jgi:hypothetical protein
MSAFCDTRPQLKACGTTARRRCLHRSVLSAHVDILPGDFELLPQHGDGVGERLAFATADLFQCGFGSVCLIDSDVPLFRGCLCSEVEMLKAGDRVVLARQTMAGIT